MEPKLCKYCEKRETYNGRGVCGECLKREYIRHCQRPANVRRSRADEGLAPDHQSRIERYAAIVESGKELFS